MPVYGQGFFSLQMVVSARFSHRLSLSGEVYPVNFLVGYFLRGPFFSFFGPAGFSFDLTFWRIFAAFSIWSPFAGDSPRKGLVSVGLRTRWAWFLRRRFSLLFELPCFLIRGPFLFFSF